MFDYYPSKVIYFIEEVGRGRIKIGYSAEPKKRLSVCQTDNSDQLKILALYQIVNYPCNEFETAFKQYLKVYNIRGEWFSITETELGYAIENCARNMDLEIKKRY